MKCVKCNNDVTEKVANYSKQKFNKILCFDCQKKDQPLQSAQKTEFKDRYQEGQRIGMAIKEANMFFIEKRKNNDTLKDATPEIWAQSVSLLAKKLLTEMDKNGY